MELLSPMLGLLSAEDLVSKSTCTCALKALVLVYKATRQEVLAERKYSAESKHSHSSSFTTHHQFSFLPSSAVLVNAAFLCSHTDKPGFIVGHVNIGK